VKFEIYVTASLIQFVGGRFGGQRRLVKDECPDFLQFLIAQIDQESLHHLITRRRSDNG
jgi:hypothetical protein